MKNKPALKTINK